MPEKTKPLIEADGSSTSSKSDDFNKLFIDVTQKFNDRTLNTLRFVAGILGGVLIVFSLISVYNVNAERDRVERALISIREEMKGFSGDPEIEILSTLDKKPLEGRIIEYTINRADHLSEKPYFLVLSYTIRNIGNSSTGPFWTKVYLEPTDIFEGQLYPDEHGYGVQTIIAPTQWTGGIDKTGTVFPGSGFSSNIQNGIKIKKNIIPKGKYKVLVKIYYGNPGHAVVSQAQAYFEISSDWIMPDDDQK